MEAAIEREAPPTEDLVRGVVPFELERDADDPSSMPTMVGYFTRFNIWTEINSLFEGHFMERFAFGSLKKTIRENRDRMRVLLNHGHDPQLGDKPLGPIEVLREEEEGPWYEVPLLDAAYVREDVLPGLEAGLYGASFRFSVMKEEFEEKPKRNKHNPDGLPERTITEAKVFEFGPVTFPAYAGATAGVRSLTDEFLIGRFAKDPDRLLKVVEAVTGEPGHSRKEESEPSEATTPVDESRPTPGKKRFNTREEYLEWIARS
jgi:HK97 family phage prohead protease